MPITSALPGPFTRTMEAMLRVQLPGYEQRAPLFRDILTSVENRSAPTARLTEEARTMAQHGTFDRVYAALQPRHQTLDTEERYALWTLKGVGEVFKAGAPIDFDQVATAVDEWKEANRAQLTSELGDLPEPRIDDLQADLFRELGYIKDERFGSGYCRPETRFAIAGRLAELARNNGVQVIETVELVIERQTRIEVLLLRNKDGFLPVRLSLLGL